MKILELEKISLTYFSKNGETVALKDISVSIENGEFVSIVGPSGCGKTTILSIIAGLIKPTSGTINNLSKSENSIGYMFQKDLLFEWLTVEKNIMLGLEINKIKTQENIDYALSLLKKYNLYEFKDKYPNELSGGMRQRVALIRTIVTKPEILLLDEAFSALDYQTRLSVCDDIYRIIKEEKLTAILVTHDITEAISMSDKILVLSNRPAVIKKTYSITHKSNTTPFTRRESIASKELFSSIWSDLQ